MLACRPLMTVILAFLAYIAVALTASIVLAIAGGALLGPDAQPHKWTDETAQLVGLLTFVPFAFWLGMRSKRAFGYGLAVRPFVRTVVEGWVLGVVMLIPLGLVLIAMGVRPLDPDWDFGLRFVQKVFTALIAGILVGLIEETFFRGPVWTAIGRRSGTAVAIVVTSALYSALHFIHFGPTAGSGNSIWANAQAQIESFLLAYPHPVAPGSAVALFFAGVLLATYRAHEGNLARAIGIHAGWVFVIAILRDLTFHDRAGEYAHWVDAYNRVTGWFAAVWIGLLALALWIRVRKRIPARPEG